MRGGAGLAGSVARRTSTIAASHLRTTLLPAGVKVFRRNPFGSRCCRLLLHDFRRLATFGFAGRPTSLLKVNADFVNALEFGAPAAGSLSVRVRCTSTRRYAFTNVMNISGPVVRPLTFLMPKLLAKRPLSSVRWAKSACASSLAPQS